MCCVVLQWTIGAYILENDGNYSIHTDLTGRIHGAGTHAHTVDTDLKAPLSVEIIT